MDTRATAARPEPAAGGGEDPIVPLMRAIIGGLDHAAAELGDRLDDWESLSLLIASGEGGQVDVYGFAYGADEAWVQAVTVRPPTAELDAFLRDRYPDGARPAKVLCQLQLTDGDYGIEFEDRGGPIRWPVNPEHPDRMQRRLRPDFPVLSPLGEALDDAGLARDWYRWCDASRDWAAEAETVYEEDSLRSASGGFAPLHVDEFMAAYRAAGAEVSRGSRDARPRNRSFTLDVAAGAVVCSLGVELGRGLNSQECTLRVLVDGEEVAGPEPLHGMARSILRSAGLPDPWPHQPYPRPIIGSRSQLEVTAQEIVEMLGQVARDWAR